MNKDFNDKKSKTISFILDNSVYSEDSRLYKSLKRSLNQMSFSNLRNLELIIQLKLQDAAESMAKSCTKGTYEILNEIARCS